MITLEPPFKASDMNGLYKKVTTGKYNPIPSTFSKDLAEVVSACLKVNPKVRPSCDELL